LTARVDCTAWPGCAETGPVDIQPLPQEMQAMKPEPSRHDAMRSLLIDACDCLVGMQDELNALDAKTGDGDTGSTVAQAARALRESLDTLPLADVPALLRAVSDLLSVSMGGSSGVLLAIMFSAASDAARTGSSIAQALRTGVNRMMVYGGAGLGDRTMIDALLPALDAWLATDSLAAAAAAARQGAGPSRGAIAHGHHRGGRQRPADCQWACHGEPEQRRWPGNAGQLW
jgi:dihydroxyacetone kinase